MTNGTKSYGTPQHQLPQVVYTSGPHPRSHAQYATLAHSDAGQSEQPVSNGHVDDPQSLEDVAVEETELSLRVVPEVCCTNNELPENVGLTGTEGVTTI